MTEHQPGTRHLRLVRPEERYWEHIPDVFGSVEDISDALITREQQNFLLTNGAGNITPDNKRGLGLYSHDARHLSVYDFLLDGAYPLVLLSTADSGFSQEQVLGNYRMTQDGHIVGRGTVELNRQRTLNHSLEERLKITNYNPFPVTIHASYVFEADFADIFEVRGHPRKHQSSHSKPEVTDRTICYRCLGADGVWRRTMVVFERAPEVIDATGATYALTVGPRETVEIRLGVHFEENPSEKPSDGLHQLRTDYARWENGFASIHTDNEVFNKVLNRSLTDLRMLWTRDGHGHGYFAAGTPWFATLFGRDSIVTALQTLPYRPDLARDCLRLLARHQGQSVDPFRSEEPGKILHEMREDELSTIGELPYERYYGSVDSTPLFLLLAAEYFHWTADGEFFKDLMPAIDAGLGWIRNYGDLDGDGLLEYHTDSVAGLRNQGWKDSVEGVMHADGRLCEGAIALVEVQGYVYAALTRLAEVFDALLEPKRAFTLRHEAAILRRRFNHAFWLPEHNRLAFCLDGQKRPSTVMSSNAGQALFSGIVSHERAAHVRDALFENDMFTGWGIRTLSSKTHSYYPLGYHLGTVWPHDNGIIANGLKHYGFDDEVNEIATALYDASRNFPSYRLPELFGGQPRSEFQPPVPYPVACRPQAWTAGTLLHLLQAVLGLRPDAANHRLAIVRPKLPYWLRQVHLQGLRVGDATLDLHFEAGDRGTTVTSTVDGDVTVEQSGSWRGLQPHAT